MKIFYLSPTDKDMVSRLYPLVSRNLDRLTPWFEWAKQIHTPMDLDIVFWRWRYSESACMMLYEIQDDKGNPIGLIRVSCPNRADGIYSLMYFLDREWEGKGIMAKALNDVMAGWWSRARWRIQAHPENQRSQKLALRLGFQRVGQSDNGELIFEGSPL